MMRVGPIALALITGGLLTGYLGAAGEVLRQSVVKPSELQSPQDAPIERQVRQDAAAASDLIDCPQPNHHDGDALRCGYHGRSMRLYAIDAPEMPGACRPGRWCVPGDPYASRDHLASLTAGRAVTYRVIGHDRYARQIVQAFADGQDVSCAMVRDGFAIERYGHLRCPK